MSKLTLTTTREATAQEIENLVWGTGALSYPWWHGAHKTKHGYRFYFDDPNEEEGTFTGNVWRSNQAILNAASRFIAEGRGGEDVADAISEDIGYFDATAADTILQYAVMGGAIYG